MYYSWFCEKVSKFAESNIIKMDILKYATTNYILVLLFLLFTLVYYVSLSGVFHLISHLSVVYVSQTRAHIVVIVLWI